MWILEPQLDLSKHKARYWPPFQVILPKDLSERVTGQTYKLYQLRYVLSVDMVYTPPHIVISKYSKSGTSE